MHSMLEMLAEEERKSTVREVGSGVVMVRKRVSGETLVFIAVKKVIGQISARRRSKIIAMEAEVVVREGMVPGEVDEEDKGRD